MTTVSFYCIYNVYPDALQFTIQPNRTITVVYDSKVWCLDLRSNRNLQV